jgi:hypothetical protein
MKGRGPYAHGLAARVLVPAAMGALVGWAVLAGLLLLDTAGLASLLRDDPSRVLITILLLLKFGGGFAVFAFASSLALGPSSRQEDSIRASEQGVLGAEIARRTREPR